MRFTFRGPPPDSLHFSSPFHHIPLGSLPQDTSQRGGMSIMAEHSSSSGISGCSNLAGNLFKRLQKIRGLGSLLILVALLSHGQPDVNQQHRSGFQQVELQPQESQERQHGPVQTRGLSLPEIPSKTHRDQAKEFSRKLVAGFGLRPGVALEFSDWILEAAARQQLQPELVASLVFAESSFRKAVQSHVGAVGPAQVRPHYWSDFCGRADLYDPEQNIYCGTQVLGYLLERCDGDRACALSAYNIGINSKRRAAGLRYVAKIDRNMAQLQSANL